MSMISEIVKRLREESFAYKWATNLEMSNLLNQAADTIEELSEKLEAANMEKSDNG